jgi:trk system potassium uptake protein TrkH
MLIPQGSSVWILKILRSRDLLVLSFAGMILVGTLALMLPQSTSEGRLSFIDALFTATSAVCVTGLTVVDTGTAFSRTGQSIILGLIQLGGLGIMMFSVVLLLLSRHRISIKDKLAAQDSLSAYNFGQVSNLVRQILAGTLLVEAIGALLLWIGAPDRDWFVSVFHAVSAFCNAGFRLHPGGFIGSYDKLGVNLTVLVLMVVGGLGFFTCAELVRQASPKTRGRLSLHTRLVLVVTVALLFGGALFFYAFESRNILASKGAGEVLLLSFFQSITARTTGFSIVDLRTLTNATLFLLILLMFVGASPGSTGGGIKTSTLGVLIAMARSRMRGEANVSLFRRTIPDSMVSRSLSVLVLAFTLVTFAVLALSFVELGFEPYTQSSRQFIEIFFEVVSAFASCGLSTGITPRLSWLGKLILILVMFVGRVGVLTVATAAGRALARVKYRYAEENVMIG